MAKLPEASSATPGYLMLRDLHATHLRRARVMAMVTSIAIVLVDSYWAIYFGLRGQWLIFCAPFVMVVIGVAVWVLALRGRMNIAIGLLSVSLFGVILGMALVLDLPSAQIPRSVHHFLIPLAVGAYLMMKEEDILGIMN